MLLNRNWTKYFDFAGRYIIAAAIEKVTDALASRSFSRAAGSCVVPRRNISSIRNGSAIPAF